jgi:hypothetical protein
MVGKVIWVCVTDDHEHCHLIPEARWIVCLNKPHWFFPYLMLNCALDQLLPMAGHLNTYIGEMSDDDGIDPGFFHGLEEAAEANRKDGVTPEVLAVSMRRWFNGPAIVDTLNPTPETMRIGMVGQEQLFIRADVMSLYRFENTPHSDGLLAEKLGRERPGCFCCLHHLFVDWNKLI